MQHQLFASLPNIYLPPAPYWSSPVLSFLFSPPFARCRFASPSPSRPPTRQHLCIYCCCYDRHHRLVGGIFHTTNPAFPLLAGILCMIRCLQAAYRPTCTALYPARIARAICRLKLLPIHPSSSAPGDDRLVMAKCASGALHVSITLGLLVRVQITISGPREGTRLCSSPNSGIDERFEDLDLDFELI